MSTVLFLSCLYSVLIPVGSRNKATAYFYLSGHWQGSSQQINLPSQLPFTLEGQSWDCYQMRQSFDRKKSILYTRDQVSMMDISFL